VCGERERGSARTTVREAVNSAVRAAMASSLRTDCCAISTMAARILPTSSANANRWDSCKTGKASTGSTVGGESPRTRSCSHTHPHIYAHKHHHVRFPSSRLSPSSPPPPPSPHPPPQKQQKTHKASHISSNFPCIPRLEHVSLQCCIAAPRLQVSVAALHTRRVQCADPADRKGEVGRGSGEGKRGGKGYGRHSVRCVRGEGRN
jgi:hypothetical protein